MSESNENPSELTRPEMEEENEEVREDLENKEIEEVKKNEKIN